MLPAGKKVIRSGVQNKRREEMPQRKLIRSRPIKRKGKSVELHVKRCRHNYNLRSSSVEFVSETPCCLNEDTRKKYASLALDSALFHCKSRPARRKQSHISIVTISSCDDEESMARTAEWVASVAIENKKIPCPEESYLNPSNSMNTASGEAEEIRKQLSLLQFPTTQTDSKTFECSTSSASTPGKYPSTTCPHSIEVGPLGVCASEKHHMSEVTDSVMSGLFHPRSSEIYQSQNLQGHRECLPLSTKISEIALNSKHAGKISRFGPTLPSIQECSSIPSSKFEKQIASTSEVRRPYSFVTQSQTSTTISSDDRRPFCTITPESHPITTPLGSEVKRSFYSSTPEKHLSSSVEERNEFCLITPTKEQVFQEYRPLFSSTPESHQNISRLGIKKSNTFCNITLEKKQESQLTNPQGNRSCMISNLEPMEAQDCSEDVLKTPSIPMQSSIFQTPFNRSLNFVNTPRNSLSITDPSIQKEKDELVNENKKQFYFGTLNTQAPFEHLFASQVEENRSAQENNSMSLYECSMSGIEPISHGNPESPQSSVTQESSIQRLESSSNSNDGSVI